MLWSHTASSHMPLECIYNTSCTCTANRCSVCRNLPFAVQHQDPWNPVEVRPGQFEIKFSIVDISMKFSEVLTVIVMFEFTTTL